MTRDEMLSVLRNGSTVLHKGRLIATEADLPTETDLAISSQDAAQKQAAREAIRAQKAALDEQLEKLDASPKAAKTGGK